MNTLQSSTTLQFPHPLPRSRLERFLARPGTRRRPPSMVFFMRLGDVLQAGILYTGTALGFVLSSFAALNLAFTIVRFFTAAVLAREFKKRSAVTAHQRRGVDFLGGAIRPQTAPVRGI